MTPAVSDRAARETVGSRSMSSFNMSLKSVSEDAIDPNRDSCVTPEWKNKDCTRSEMFSLAIRYFNSELPAAIAVTVCAGVRTSGGMFLGQGLLGRRRVG